MKNDVRFNFVSFPLFGFTLVIKLRNVDFESHWNTSIFFDQRNDVRFGYVLSNSVISFKLCRLSRILAVSWEIQTLNFTEVHVCFSKQRFFLTRPPYYLNFSWIELQMLLRCCLIHKSSLYWDTIYIKYICGHVLA